MARPGIEMGGSMNFSDGNQGVERPDVGGGSDKVMTEGKRHTIRIHDAEGELGRGKGTLIVTRKRA